MPPTQRGSNPVWRRRRGGPAPDLGDPPRVEVAARRRASSLATTWAISLAVIALLPLSWPAEASSTGCHPPATAAPQHARATPARPQLPARPTAPDSAGAARPCEGHCCTAGSAFLVLKRARPPAGRGSIPLDRPDRSHQRASLVWRWPSPPPCPSSATRPGSTKWPLRSSASAWSRRLARSREVACALDLLGLAARLALLFFPMGTVAMHGDSQQAVTSAPLRRRRTIDDRHDDERSDRSWYLAYGPNLVVGGLARYVGPVADHSPAST